MVFGRTTFEEVNSMKLSKTFVYQLFYVLVRSYGLDRKYKAASYI